MIKIFNQNYTEVKEMFCRTCGREIHDEALICPYCGCGTGKMKNANRGNDAKSFGWALLGFLIPIIGLILFLLWKEEYPLRAKSVGKGALTSVIVSVVVSILYAILIGSMLSEMTLSLCL